MSELISVSLEPRVWQEVLETLEAATKEGAGPETNKERLKWYDRSHAILSIQKLIPKKRNRSKANGQVEIEA